jgi:hypothetical protein
MHRSLVTLTLAGTLTLATLCEAGPRVRQPPPRALKLSLIVLLVTVRLPSLAMPPPTNSALLSAMVL